MRLHLLGDLRRVGVIRWDDEGHVECLAALGINAVRPQLVAGTLKQFLGASGVVAGDFRRLVGVPGLAREIDQAVEQCRRRADWSEPCLCNNRPVERLCECGSYLDVFEDLGRSVERDVPIGGTE